MSKLRDELWRIRMVFYRGAFHRLVYPQRTQREIVHAFHRLYYDSYIVGETWQQTFWLGSRALKCPLDLWVYQEIIHEQRPDVIIETGTAEGGSALFLASVCELLGGGRVITIDIHEPTKSRPEHPRITYVIGSSIDPAVVSTVEASIDADAKVMVILDSDHSKDHVVAELHAYSRLVTSGSYLVVEDTNLNGHPVEVDFGPGPMEAVEEFLASNHDFTVDTSCEKFYLTMNPKGYLRRTR